MWGLGWNAENVLWCPLFQTLNMSFVFRSLPWGLVIYLPAFFWIFMPKCQDVGCPSTPVTDHDWYRRGVSEVLQNNRDHVGSSFHYECHHRNPLADSCIKKGKEKEKRRKEHKASKPNKQKEKKKHKLKLLSMGEVMRYERIKYWVTFVENSLVEFPPPESPRGPAQSPQLTRWILPHFTPDHLGYMKRESGHQRKMGPLVKMLEAMFWLYVVSYLSSSSVVCVRKMEVKNFPLPDYHRSIQIALFIKDKSVGACWILCWLQYGSVF